MKNTLKKKRRVLLNRYEFFKRVLFIIQAQDKLNKKIGSIVPIDALEKEAIKLAKKEKINFTKKEFVDVFVILLFEKYFFFPKKDFVQKMGDINPK